MDKLITFDKIKEHYTKVLPHYPECKLLEYQLIKERRHKRPYRKVQSNRQIATIIEIAHRKKGMRAYHRLVAILAKHIHVKHYTKFLNQFLYKDLDDDEIYKLLQRYLKRYKEGTWKPKHCDDHNVVRTQIFFYHIKEHILAHDKIRIKRYLDVGCGDCLTTKLLGDMLDLQSHHIHGADIPNWGAYSGTIREKSGVKISEINPKTSLLPYQDNYFEFVSALMVLHHVKKLNITLSEINRVLKKSGYFFIREHDAMNNVDYMLTDIEHAMYEVVRRNNQNFQEEYYAKYYDWLEWDLIMKHYGFEYVKAHYESDSIYYEIGATRYYYAIYRKVKNLD